MTERNDVIKYVRATSRDPFMTAKDLAAVEDGVHLFVGVSFALFAKDTLGIVADSDTDTSALAAILAGERPASEGTLAFAPGTAGAHHPPRCVRIHPARGVRYRLEERTVSEVITAQRSTRREAERRLKEVGLPAACLNVACHRLSASHQQLVEVARALGQPAEVLICEGIDAVLDPVQRAIVFNLLIERQRREALSIVYISHDLAAVHHVCDRIMVLHRGHVVDYGSRNDVIYSSSHEFTQELVAATPGDFRR